MTERHSSAVRIHPLYRHLEPAYARKRLRGERFVYLYHVHVVYAQSRTLHYFRNRGNRAYPHHRRFYSYRRKPDKFGDRCVTEFLGSLARHKHDKRTAVRHLRRRRRRNNSVALKTWFKL
ncbi:hypothetical protein SDC9_181097 [bioreactor metagenome]|uniref:Uncharacterized protein n=1 Tax=bioreactor metagenome TaxID=1076179 RepID=A0A645H3K3_9ZZZZ